MSITQRQRKIERIFTPTSQATRDRAAHDYSHVVPRSQRNADFIAQLSTLVLGSPGGYRKPRLPSSD